MKWRKDWGLKFGKYDGVWFLWPAIIWYSQLGVELRFLKWYVGVDWKIWRVK